MTLPPETTVDRPPLTGQLTAPAAGQLTGSDWPTLPPVNTRGQRADRPADRPADRGADRPPVSRTVDRGADRLTGASLTAPTVTTLTGQADTPLTAPTDHREPLTGQPTTTTQPANLTTTARRLARDRGPLWLLGIFYAVMAGISLYGQTQGIITWFHIQPLTVLGWVIPARVPALVPAGALELLATVLLAFADWRRRTKREKARLVRLAAAASAAGVAWLNWEGHDTAAPRVLFVGASAAAFVVVALHIGARYRDAHPNWITGRAPDYGAVQWLTEPRLTLRARRIALSTDDDSARPGRAESLSLAAEAIARQEKLARLAAAVRARIADGTDPLTAELAIASLDLEGIARRLADAADNTGMAALLGADLTPHRLTGPPPELEQAPATATTERPRTTHQPRRQHQAPRPARRRAAAHRQAAPAVVTERVPEAAPTTQTEAAAPPTAVAAPESEASNSEVSNVVDLASHTPQVAHGIAYVTRWLDQQQQRTGTRPAVPSATRIHTMAGIGKGTALKVKEHLDAAEQTA